MPTIRSDSSYKPMRMLPLAIACLVVVTLAIAGRVAYTLFPPDISITVNGQPATLSHDATVEDALALELATPEPGDLLAIDGTLLEEGGGTPYVLSINGKPVYALDRVLQDKDALEIADGEDSTEAVQLQYAETQPRQAIAGTGAIHLYDRGQVGITERATGMISGIKRDTVMQEVGTTTFLSYNANTGDDKVIALTFDDDPWEGATAEILDILDEYDVRATFFVVGNRVEGQASVVKRAHGEGHQICTHTWSHASGKGQGVNLGYLSAKKQIEEVTKGYEAIASAIGVEPSRVIRAPGGNYYDEVIWNLEPYVDAEIGWNVDTHDWEKPGADVIADRIKMAEAGDIVLMHDGGGDRSQTVEALRIAIPYLQEQGYTFVTIDELLAYGVSQ